MPGPPRFPDGGRPAQPPPHPAVRLGLFPDPWPRGCVGGRFTQEKVAFRLSRGRDVVLPLEGTGFRERAACGGDPEGRAAEPRQDRTLTEGLGAAEGAGQRGWGSHLGVLVAAGWGPDWKGRVCLREGQSRSRRTRGKLNSGDPGPRAGMGSAWERGSRRGGGSPCRRQAPQQEDGGPVLSPQISPFGQSTETHMNPRVALPQA